MLPPAVLIIGVNRFRAEGASNSARRFRSFALVPVEFLLQKHSLASVVVLVLVHLAALLKQVLFHLLDLDYLVAFPASRQHWAFFPVVDV